jgi:hypothetical protein
MFSNLKATFLPGFVRVRTFPFHKTLGDLNPCNILSLYTFTNYRASLLQVVFELPAAAGVAQLAQCLSLYLANSLPGHIKFLPYLF